MEIIKPSFEILGQINGEEIIKKIELAARNCYKSEEHIGDIERTKKFISGIIKSGHESVIEHCSISARVICDRGVSHEIVRHRIASYSQESTRYCNYKTKGLVFIKPCFWEEDNVNYTNWFDLMMLIEQKYNAMIYFGATPQEARSILPNSLKTEIIMTLNLRSWRNFFKQRTSNHAHPQIREIARPMLDEFKRLIPVIFDDITYENET